LDAKALMADVFEHKRKAEVIQKLQKSTKVEQSKGYFGKVAAADRSRKGDCKKAVPGKPKSTQKVSTPNVHMSVVSLL
jgi:hypothetical protein